MPREIFEDLVNEEKAVLKKLKPEFKSMVKGHGIRFNDSSFATFDSTLKDFEAYIKLTDLEK